MFIKLLNQPNKHNAINRNILRSLQSSTISEAYQGPFLDVCFKLLNSNVEPVAVKSFSLTIIEKIAEFHPEILNELRSSLQMQLPNTSPGLKGRVSRILGVRKNE